jgi:hypothetical protein
MEKDHSSYITVTSGISGYYAVLMTWNTELGGFWEPYNTGIGRYKKREKAVQEGKMWAEDEEVRYVD